MIDMSERQPRGRRIVAICVMAGALVVAGMAGPGQARLPNEWGGMALHALSADAARETRRGLKAPVAQMSPMSWRCQSVCDENGHVRQSCLMLADPRLSGLGQRLDHLSSAKPALKSLGDLGLSNLDQAPSC